MEITDICRMVARSLFAEIGPWGNRCALIGGLIPGLLVPEPGEILEPHVGTSDVDLAIRVAAVGDDQEMYRTLIQNFANLNLKQDDDRSFKWKRTVEGADVVVELFVPVTDPEQGGKIQRKPIEKSGSGLTALGVYGLDLIDRDIVMQDDEGPLLDGRGVKRVSLRLCGPAVLLGLKAWALLERTKDKDGCDIVWMLKAQGAPEMADKFLAARLHETDFGNKALDYLSDGFKTHQHTGPLGWANESGFEGDQAVLEARTTAGIVQEFVSLVRRGSTSTTESTGTGHR